MAYATLFSETIKGGGGAHHIDFRVFSDFGIILKHPFGRAINPITGTNWEGTGVTPRIEVQASQALNVARLKILNTLIEQEKDESRRNRLNFSLRLLNEKSTRCSPTKKH